MEANPYAAPVASGNPNNVRAPARQMLKRVATRQRWLIACVGLSMLLYVGLMAVGSDLPRFVAQVLAAFSIATIIATAALTFLLASSLYKPRLACLIVLPGLFPFFSPIILLLVNIQAIRVLRRSGIRIGLLGADPSSI